MKRIPTQKPSTILIVDDHSAPCAALVSRIARYADLEVCGIAANTREALLMVSEANPDIVLVDISIESGCGIELIKRIKDHKENVRMLVWSMCRESIYAERTLRAGALAYINKNRTPDEIIDAIRRVLDGNTCLSDALIRTMLHRAVGGVQVETGRSPLLALADRELEVFLQIGRGAKTAEIAERLHLSATTIKTYRHRIRKKLMLKDSTELSHYAEQWFLEKEYIEAIT